MFVADIMSKDVITVSPDHSLAEVASVFEVVKFRHLLVASNGKLEGIISDRDVVAHISPFLGTIDERESDRDLMNQKAYQFMSTEIITVDCETLVDSASILLLEHSISCLPVTYDDGSIAGILSWKDILQYHVYGVDRTLDYKL
ncbi:CBS domain-containing protein [Teredinibacter sp. KSP-S5-2]|uniref:CBS domain-containing protein n=1 Tax=Teredinibacter sp. KSP-S5-2 TaxID=3034506 RepID=UPI0029346860|nr:CBS domain-containing protein [Teredinibacter sp. KSP-S5-2]WNO11577.1 CBS domain-containing protein [Teredinibacter sp. KSP-S5-2]